MTVIYHINTDPFSISLLFLSYALSCASNCLIVKGNENIIKKKHCILLIKDLTKGTTFNYSKKNEHNKRTKRGKQQLLTIKNLNK